MSLHPVLEPALQVLRAGGLVCVPTESSYGLAVDAGNEAAIEALHRLKGRPNNAPFALIAGSMEMAKRHTGTWPPAAELLAAEHWPGPLTLVLPPTQGTSVRLLGPSGGVGVRVSSCELTRSLSLALGRPITATSANPSAKPAAQSVQEAQSYFARAVECYIDAGNCSGIPSTLVDFDAAGQAQVLRAGPIVLPQCP